MAQWISDWPRGWHSGLMEGTLSGPVTQLDRVTAVDVHQLRAEHWTLGTGTVRALPSACTASAGTLRETAYNVTPWIFRGAYCPPPPRAERRRIRHNTYWLSARR